LPAAAFVGIADRASDKCLRERRKTINGDDLLWAMQTLGFEDYQEPLKIYLTKYREAEVRSPTSVVICICSCSPPTPPFV